MSFSGHIKHKESVSYRIGWVSPEVVEEVNFRNYLTPGELNEVQQARHGRKQLQKKAVRTLIKALVLSKQVHTHPFNLHKDLLDQYPMTDYHRIEIQPALSGKTHLAIYLDGHETDWTVSITHGNAISIACLGTGNSIGIDIESPIQRRREFYEQNFTSYEREWVYNNLLPERDEDWLFTFLWTIKESLIKSGRTVNRSAWYIPEFAIQRLPQFEEFNDKTDTLFTIYDGQEYFKAATRLYSFKSQVLTTSIFYR